MLCYVEQHENTWLYERSDTMNATKQIGTLEERKMVDTNGLQAMLSSGRKTAVEIGTAAQARVQVGRRIFWNVKKIQKYLDTVSE